LIFTCTLLSGDKWGPDLIFLDMGSEKNAADRGGGRHSHAIGADLAVDFGAWASTHVRTANSSMSGDGLYCYPTNLSASGRRVVVRYREPCRDAAMCPTYLPWPAWISLAKLATGRSWEQRETSATVERVSLGRDAKINNTIAQAPGSFCPLSFF